jgi:inhibitor of cysteine peptidase
MRSITLIAILFVPFHLSRADDEKGKTLTETDNKTKITLNKGETLTVKLDGTPTAGYSWSIAGNNKEQLAPHGKPEVVPAKKGVIGGKATTVFRFKAEAAGTSELELHYKRPFEKKNEPDKSFKVTVEIK